MGRPTFRFPPLPLQTGDRAGICVTQFDSSKLERGVACSPSSMPLTFAALIDASKIPHFKSDVKTGSKLHVSIGHETQTAKLSFFGGLDDAASQDGVENAASKLDELSIRDFDWTKDYVYLESMSDDRSAGLCASSKEDGNPEVASEENYTDSYPRPKVTRRYAVVEFDHPICILPNSLVIGSKLDADIHQNSCRIALSGRVLQLLQDKDYSVNDLSKLKVFKSKRKEGIVERMSDPYTVIAKGIMGSCRSSLLYLVCLVVKKKCWSSNQFFLQVSSGRNQRLMPSSIYEFRFLSLGRSA